LGPRVDALDLLRGLAILGIFVMNTWTMSMPQEAYTNPATYSPDWILGQGFPDVGYALKPLTGVNYWTYFWVHMLADMKFITMFSIMFGAGIVLQSERARVKGKNPWTIHYLRMAVLLCFGLVHSFAFWYGDILTDYAICGLILGPLRLLPSAVLALAAILMISGVSGIDYVRTHQSDNVVMVKSRDAVNQIDQLQNKIRDGWDAKMLARGEDFMVNQYYNANDYELDIYQGTPDRNPLQNWWREVLGHRGKTSVVDHTTGFLDWVFPRCGGCILLGMALQKRRFFHGRWGAAAYALMAAVALPIGWTIVAKGIWYNDANRWNEDSLWHNGVEFNYWGSLFCTFGYMCVGVLFAMAAASRRWLNLALMPLRSVGRMALSNYLTQSVVGTTLFYGHGLGLFGKVSRFGLLPIVFAMWFAQLVASTIWLRYFRQGPLEWLWHSIVYWKWKSPLLPVELRRRALTSEEPAQA
ncbi:MAG TPA: DUF418 domain-containing protein, partial [Candidatus Dormibacteraeota bacterium]|nr:DUF418 domain-containing protein [Candidatus Dormibacteraeota bacterium]